MDGSAAVSAGCIRRFWLVARWFTLRLSELTGGRDRGEDGAAENLQACVERLNPPDGSPGDVFLAGNAALHHAREHFPTLLPAVDKLHSAFERVLTEAAPLGEAFAACTELREAIEQHAPAESDAILAAAAELERLADKLPEKFSEAPREIPRTASSAATTPGGEQGIRDHNAQARSVRGKLLNRFYCRGGEAILRALEAGALWDDAQALSTIGKAYHHPNVEAQQAGAFLDAVQRWLPDRLPGYGGLGRHYPDSDLDVGLDTNIREMKKTEHCLRGLAALLREDCRRQAGSAELRNDETVATQKQLPAPQLLDALRTSLAALAKRFENAAERCRPLAAVAVHQSTPGNVPEPDWPDLHLGGGKHLLCIGGGPRCEGRPLDSHPAWQRTYRLYGEQFRGSTPEDYADGLREWQDAGAEAGRVLLDLPDRVRAVVWREWKHGFAYTPSEVPHLWVHAVFELAWQEHAGSRLSAERWAWRGRQRIRIEDLPKQRTGEGLPTFDELARHVGDPPAYWYSGISNVWRASVAAVEILGRLLRETPERVAAKLSPAGVAGVRALALHFEVHGHPGIHARRFQDLVRDEGGDPLASSAELLSLGVMVARDDAYQQATVYDFEAEYVQGIVETLGTTPKSTAERRDAPASPSTAATVSSDEAAPSALASPLTPSVRRAYEGWLLVEPELSARATDREAYELLQEKDHRLAENLPAPATWVRYVREGRAAHGQQKNTPRRGRATGRSVVERQDL
jgi:hypothetical protein